MLIGAIIGGIVAGAAMRHWCWPWERRVYIERPVYIDRFVDKYQDEKK